MNKFDNILNLFLPKEEGLDWMKKPFACGNEICSTNGIILIFFDRSLSEHTALEDKTNKVGKIINTYKSKRVISLNDQISDLFRVIPLIDEYEILRESEICEECDGEGEVEWEYRHYTEDFECPACNGRGGTLEKKKATGKQIPDLEHYNIKLGVNIFRAKMLADLMRVSDELGEPLFFVGDTLSEQPSFFRCGPINIIASPVSSYGTYIGEITT